MKVTTIEITDFNNKLEFKVTGEESDNQLLMLGYLEVLKAEIIKSNKPKQPRCRNCGTPSKSVYCSVQCKEDVS